MPPRPPVEAGVGLTLPRPVHLLLVEDSESDAALVRALLRRPSGAFAIQHVGSLKLAIEALQTSKPHLVLLDLGLPDSFGTASVARLGLQDAGVGLVVLSDSSLDQSGPEAVALGADDYLEKSELERENLLLVLGSVLGRRQVLGGPWANAVGDLATGAGNEAALSRLLGSLEASQRAPGAWALLIIQGPPRADHDFFQALNYNLRPREQAFRLGASRSAVVFPVADPEAAALRAEALRAGISGALPARWTAVFAGLALLSPESPSAAASREQAEAALARATERGRPGLDISPRDHNGRRAPP